MAPKVTVLQLDTRFPRVPGDVACPATYRGALEILKVPNASVSQVVSNRPDLIDIAPFEEAMAQATGDVILTSCGFLSSWQSHLEARTSVPFISSSLTALKTLSRHYNPQELMILTFDANSLTNLHFGGFTDYRTSVVGLSPDLHLRQVISQDLPDLEQEQAEQELAELVQKAQRPSHKHILLECTNLPPYKPALTAQTGLGITDILTCTEAQCAGAVQPAFLQTKAMT